MEKTFLLVMPDYSDFPELFAKNLLKTGFKPYVVTDGITTLRYTVKDKLINFYKKTVKKDRSYKQKLISQQKTEQLDEKLSKLPEKLDYILVIRPDHFEVSFIKKLKKRTEKLIAYQWDGFEKFPEARNYVQYFDSFFCFETEDDPRLKSSTNFYFDFEEPIKKKSASAKALLYFVGSYLENREKKIDRFIQETSKIDVELSIIIQYWQKNEKKNPKINYIKERISFAENLENVQKADILIDFVDPLHHGLSIRFFEGLYYKKKVITDNIEVKNYDFYHPDNIFILENDNYDEMELFLSLPYREISEEIVKKYGFSNWIKRITQ